MYKVGMLFSIQWTLIQCKFQHETLRESDLTSSHWRLLFHVSDQPIKSHFAGDQPISFSERSAIGLHTILTGF